MKIDLNYTLSFVELTDGFTVFFNRNVDSAYVESILSRYKQGVRVSRSGLAYACDGVVSFGEKRTSDDGKFQDDFPTLTCDYLTMVDGIYLLSFEKLNTLSLSFKGNDCYKDGVDISPDSINEIIQMYSDEKLMNDEGDIDVFISKAFSSLFYGIRIISNVNYNNDLIVKSLKSYKTSLESEIIDVENELRKFGGNGDILKP